MKSSTQNSQQTDNRETWEMALQWVSAHRKLIRQIASPYIRHMTADSDDLSQEAVIAAFKALIASRKKEKPGQFIPFFRVIFKTNCIKLASGVQAMHNLEDHHIPCPERPEVQEEPGIIRIEEALQVVSTRQREVCIWILQQPEPVSTPELAKKFKVSRRHACRLISDSIQRISSPVL
ncbi:MAG: sigma-70 family RNA polymerase sigma factor [Desulfobulbaceae bacterium]|nr:MAG: sigma-70 family RNA polymerase sigma factor [Desulfobulbaceae bacterium]